MTALPGPAVSRTVALAAGLVATAVGLGIGPAHLSKVGWSVATVAGLTCLAVGAVLLVGGFVATVRATPRWWRLLVVPVLLVVAYAGLWSGGLAVAATAVPRTTVGSATPADRGLDFADVRFATADGVLLAGWYIPAAGDPAAG